MLDPRPRGTTFNRSTPDYPWALEGTRVRSDRRCPSPPAPAPSEVISCTPPCTWHCQHHSLSHPARTHAQASNTPPLPASLLPPPARFTPRLSAPQVRTSRLRNAIEGIPPPRSSSSRMVPNDFWRRPGRHDIVIAGCASAQVTPRPYPPTHAPHTLSAPPTDPTLRASGSRRPPSGCARSSTRTCSRSRSSWREDERVDRDPRRRAMDLLLIGARGRRAGGRGAGRPKGGPGARGGWGRLHRRAQRAWAAGAAAQAGWGRWERRAGGAAHVCMYTVYVPANVCLCESSQCTIILTLRVYR